MPRQGLRSPARQATCRWAGRAAGLLVLALAACALSPQPDLSAVSAAPQRLILLGEVHDNRAQHAARVQALKARLARGERPALVMEQFDRERQPLIDRLRTAQPPVTAATLIAEAGAKGWDWALYQPFVELALDHQLPLLAGNVSRESARAVMREGLAAQGFDAAVPADLLAGHAEDIEASHCGQVDAALARRMALAQVARDQAMARAVEVQLAAGRPVWLLAGNGHVRKDLGVPRWLSPQARPQALSVGLLEQGAEPAEAQAFDLVIPTPRERREDPCAAMPRIAPGAAKPS